MAIRTDVRAVSGVSGPRSMPPSAPLAVGDMALTFLEWCDGGGQQMIRTPMSDVCSSRK